MCHVLFCFMTSLIPPHGMLFSPPSRDRHVMSNPSVLTLLPTSWVSYLFFIFLFIFYFYFFLLKKRPDHKALLTLTCNPSVFFSALSLRFATKTKIATAEVGAVAPREGGHEVPAGARRHRATEGGEGGEGEGTGAGGPATGAEEPERKLEKNGQNRRLTLDAFGALAVPDSCCFIFRDYVFDRFLRFDFFAISYSINFYCLIWCILKQ